MNDADYSRIDELFWQETGSTRYEINLKGFMRHAIDSYRNRYHTLAGKPRCKVFSYIGSDKQSGIELSVMNVSGELGFNSVAINGQTNNLDNMLGFLSGHVHAEYDGLEIEALPKNYSKAIRKRKGQDIVFCDPILFTLASKNGSDPLIMQLSLGGIPKKKSKLSEFRPIYVEGSKLDPMIKDMLAKAQQVDVKNSRYIHGDNRKAVLHENFAVLQTQPSIYKWNYSIAHSTDEHLPGEVFMRLYCIFGLNSRLYSPKTFLRTGVKNPRSGAIVMPEK